MNVMFLSIAIFANPAEAQPPETEAPVIDTGPGDGDGAIVLDEPGAEVAILGDNLAAAERARDEVLALDQPEAAGSQWQGAYKVPGRDPLPAGVTLQEDRNRLVVTGAFEGTLEGWDLTGLGVDWMDGVARVRNCLFGEADRARGDIFFYLRVRSAARLADISWNTFQGPNGYGGPVAALKQDIAGEGRGITIGGAGLVARNRFLDLTNDAYKIAGGEVRENHIRYRHNLDGDALPWRRTAAYAAGALARNDRNQVFRSKTDGNRANPVPERKKDSQFWENLDPHVDALNPYATADRIEIRRNLIDMRSNGPRTAGFNNAIRSVPNSNSAHYHGAVVIAENVVLYDPTIDNRPLDSSPAGSSDFEPDAFIGNWLQPNRGGKFVADVAPGTVWRGNRELDTAQAVPAPDGATTEILSVEDRAIFRLTLKGRSAAGARIEARTISPDGQSVSEWAEIAVAGPSGAWTGAIRSTGAPNGQKVEIRNGHAPDQIASSDLLDLVDRIAAP